MSLLDLLHLNIQIRGGNNMTIAMASLTFLGGAIPLVQELLKAFV